MTIDLNPAIDIEASVEARHRQYAQGCVKLTEDLERYEAVVAKVEPSLVVEVGTFSGKSAFWFSQFAPVLTIDVNEVHSIEPAIDGMWGTSPHPIRQAVGQSTDLGQVAPRIMSSIARHPGPMLLILDGDHSRATVEWELTLYAHLAAYIVVEDTMLRWFPEDEQVYDGDPLDALEEWLPSHPEWEIDTEVESMHPVTQHIAGWLKRTENT